jgi:hypothetical protein
MLRGSSLRLRRRLEPPQNLLQIIQSLVVDGRIDIEQSCEEGFVKHSLLLYPSIVLPLISSNLARPFQSLGARERLRFFQERLLETSVTPSLFASAFPATEAFASMFRASGGDNPIHLIAAYMASEIDTQWCNTKTRDSRPLHVLFRDSTLHLWEHLLREWIRLGCNLFGLNRNGHTPLQCFLGQFACHDVLSTEDLFQIRYWAKYISNAGIDLIEYGTEELRVWRKSFRVGSRYPRNALGGHFIELLATGFRFGATYDNWHLEVVQKVSVPVYRIDNIPGSWPEAATLPQTIAWDFSRTELRDGETCTLMRTVKVTLGPLPCEDPAPMCVRLFQGTQDDNIALARLLVANNAQSTRRRRRGSQPPPLSHLPSCTRFVYHDEWAPVYFYYCLICCRMILTRSPAGHRLAHTQGGFSEQPVWSAEQVWTNLMGWKMFISEHGVSPVVCGRYRSLAYPVSLQTVEAEQVFDGTYDFLICVDFPHCLHQRSYLDLISNGPVETN